MKGRAMLIGVLPSRGQLRQLRRTFQALLALLGILLLLVLVFSSQADSFCSDHQVGCGLGTGFVSTALIVLAGYFFLFSWSLRRAISFYVEVARSHPERLFVAPPRLRADPAGRESLTTGVAQELVFSKHGAPVLVAGEAGSGKTTFLLGLIRHLANNGAVPVLVSLRGAFSPLDFRSLAEQEFLRRIDPVVRSEGDAQRIWRRLSSEGTIVVVADGLDEIAPGLTRHERDYLIRFALVAARNDRLSVVVTSRPEAVPAGAPVSQFELGDLEEEEALAYLRKSVRPRGEDGLELLRRTIEAGRITHTPYYLNIVASLFRAERLPPADRGSRDALLVALLDEWTELLYDERFLEEVELEEGQRRKIVEDLASVAYAMTLDSVLDCNLSRLRDVLDDPATGAPALPSDLPMVIEGAVRLDLVRASSAADDTAIRFNHAISQAYLASRFLRRVPDAWKKLLERTTSPEMRESLLMWCAQSGDRQTAQHVCSALVERAGELSDDRALALVVTAAEIANSVGMPDFPDLVRDGAEAAWTEASPRGKVAAVRRLEGRSDEWAYGTLYEATRDKNYRVRWSAARAIVNGGPDAYAALAPTIAGLLTYAESHPPEIWDKPRTHDVSVLGWILPALRARVSGPASEELERDVERLAALVRRGIPLGTEASVAQGFKLGSFVNPTASVSPAALALVDECRFWYARIVLLQAICVAALSHPNGKRTALARMRATQRDEREHPFVREAARLCAKAIRSPVDWRKYVWEDEGSVIGRSGSMLAKEATPLLADLVLLLNVTEQGADDVREARKERTFGAHELPYCLSASKDRKELFDGCHASCSFNLCPYPSTAELALARGEFSQAFSRRQIETLTGFSRIHELWRRKPGGRWGRSGRAALASFWLEMERRVA